jgi:hypothetical protein
VKSCETKRREAWQLIAWVGAVVAGLLILYCLSSTFALFSVEKGGR